MQIAIIDYGMGNLHSVLKSVWTAGQLAGKNTEIFLSGDPDRVSRADKVIFPGQGAMPDCIAALTRGGLDEAVKDALKKQTLFRNLRRRATFIRPQRRRKHRRLGLVRRQSQTL